MEDEIRVKDLEWEEKCNEIQQAFDTAKEIIATYEDQIREIVEYCDQLKYSHHQMIADSLASILKIKLNYDGKTYYGTCRKCGKPFGDINTKCPEAHRVDTSSVSVY